MFTKQIGKNIDAYIDYIIKSKKTKRHVQDLLVFEMLRKHTIMLNPEKCVLEVVLGKFLGFIVSQRGIKANLEKIQAIIEM